MKVASQFLLFLERIGQTINRKKAHLFDIKRPDSEQNKKRQKYIDDQEWPDIVENRFFSKHFFKIAEWIS